MKHRICISIDESVLEKAYDLLRSKQFQNKSKIFEYAFEKVFRNNQ